MTVPEAGETITVTAIEPLHGVQGHTEVWVTAVEGSVTYSFRRLRAPRELLAFFTRWYTVREPAHLTVDPEAPVTLEGEVKSVYTRDRETHTVNCKLTGIIVGPHVWP